MVSVRNAVSGIPSRSLWVAWRRHLRNAAALARRRVLSCLREEGCQDIVGVGAGGDDTTRFDQVAERAVIEYLQRFMSFILISEELGERQIGDAPEGYIILDPIDGSTNLSRNLPMSCVSVAFATDLTFEAIKVAVIMDVASGQCYHAVRNQGAYRDTHRIRPAEPSPFEISIIGVDSYFPVQRLKSATDTHSNLVIRYTRHFGSNALELCFVADGKLDGFVDLRGVFRGTDLAAAFLILCEAGAVLIDPSEQPISGECSNNATYAFVAARDLQFAKILLKLAKQEETKEGH